MTTLTRLYLNQFYKFKQVGQHPDVEFVATNNDDLLVIIKLITLYKRHALEYLVFFVCLI